MTRSLHISTELTFPLDWMSLATVVYGSRGSGKTTFGAVCAEEVTKARQRFCAVDLKGDWYGLKSTADGKGDGIPTVVFGGDHADVPLEEGAGKFLGETVAGLSQSCILDLELLSKGKQIRFLAEFFETLYHVNRDPLLLLMDESQRYAPQKPGPDEARCLGAVQDTVKLGRKHGLGVVVFTQRGAGLNKEVSELCDMLVAFRTPGPLDQDRIKDWLDANTTKVQRDDVMGKLSGLPTGTAVFASGHPDLKIFGEYAVRRRETFDSSATPKVGHRRVEPKVLAKPALVELREKMAAAIERQKADDPKALRARIAELEKQVKAKLPVVTSFHAKPERVEVPVVDEASVNKLHDLVNGNVAILSKAVRNAQDAIHAAFGEHRAELRRAAKTAKVRVLPIKTQGAGRQHEPAVMSRVATERQGKSVALSNGAGDASIGSMERMDRKFLTALAQYPEGRTRKQVLTLAGYADSGPVGKAFARLRSNGWIIDAGRLMQITDAGRSALGPFDPLPTGEYLIAHWLEKLDKMPSALLRVLVEGRGEEIPRKEVLNRAGYADSGPIGKSFALLRRLELMRDGSNGMSLREETFS